MLVPKEYEFSKPKKEIVKIEIVDIGKRSNNNSFEERALYLVEDTEAFFEEFESMKCSNFAHYEIANSTGVKFTYSDGSYELVGNDGGFIYDPNTGELSTNRRQMFSNDEFSALMEKYSSARYSGEPSEYSFMHNTSEIVEIQLVDIINSHTGSVPIERKDSYTITDVDAFLTDFRKVECKMGGNPNLIREEKRVILIKYKTGEYEYIGAEGVFRISSHLRCNPFRRHRLSVL